MGHAMKPLTTLLLVLLVFATICHAQIVFTNGNLLVTDSTNTSSWYQGNGGGLTNLNATNLIGVLPQYPTVQIATNTPFTNAVLISPDGTNRAWSAATNLFDVTGAAALVQTFANGVSNNVVTLNTFTTNATLSLSNQVAGKQAALTYQPATNGGPVAYSQLPYVPQPATENLTNWSNIGTNQFLGTNVLPALTNQFAIINGGTMTNLTIYDTVAGTIYTTWGANGIVRTNTGTGNNFQQMSTSLTFGNSNNVVQSQFGNTGTGTVINVIANGGTNTWNFNTNGLLVGNGGGLTNLNATNLVGTEPLSAVNPAVVTNNAPGVTLGGTFNGNASSATTAGTATNSPIGLFGSAATNSASAFQPANANLTNFSILNGTGLTNLPFAKTFTSTNLSFTITVNPDGSTNFALTITNLAGLSGGSAPGVCPVGGIIAWTKSFTGTPALSTYFVECNGQVLSDAGSVYNGQTVPDLNGASDGVQKFLRGSQTSGTTGGNTITFLSSCGQLAFPGYGAGNSELFMYTPADGGDNLPNYYEVVWVWRVK
jgi:hypothetical protein